MKKLRRALPYLLFPLLSCAGTWPLVLHATDHIPRGSERAATVPFVSAWALWWTSDRAAHGFARYWDAPIFHPSPATFAYSEPMPLAGLSVTPLLWLGVSIPLAYNLFVLATLTLNGLSSWWLLRRLGLSAGAALGAGSIVCLLPAVHHQLAVLTLVPVFGIVLTFAALRALAQAPSARTGVALGVAFAVTYLLCAQYALFLALSLAPAAAIAVGRRLFSRRALGALALGLCVAGAAVAPVAIAQRDAVSSQHFQRSDARARRGAASIRAWSRAPAHMLLPVPGVDVTSAPGRALFPGILKLALAVVGAGYGLRRASRRRGTALVLGTACFSLLLSGAPHLELGWVRPYHALAALVPGLAQVRSLWRAGILTQLCLALLAGHGLHALRVWGRRDRRGMRRWVGGASFALGLMAAVEIWPAPAALAAMPDVRAYGRWAAFMRTLPEGEPYCLLPFARSGAVEAFVDTARFMLLTAQHGRPMVNGYSSYFPEPHEALWRLRPRAGDPRTTEALRARGVRWIVVRGPLTARVDPTWRLRFSEPALALAVYELGDESG